MRHGAWVRGQINLADEDSQFIYNTFPTAASRTAPLTTRAPCLCGDHKHLNSSAIVEIEAKMLISSQVRGVFWRRNIHGGSQMMSFTWKNRGWDEFSRASELTTVEILVCSLDFVLEHWKHGLAKLWNELTVPHRVELIFELGLPMVSWMLNGRSLECSMPISSPRFPLIPRRPEKPSKSRLR